MRNLSLLCLSLFILMVLWTSQSCTNDMALSPAPCDNASISFEQEIVPLLQTYCYFPDGANSCHINGTAPGNFQTFDEVNNRLSQIQNRVLSLKDMPPDYSTDGPKSMNDEDLNTFRTWVEEGACNN